MTKHSDLKWLAQKSMLWLLQHPESLDTAKGERVRLLQMAVESLDEGQRRQLKEWMIVNLTRSRHMKKWLTRGLRRKK